MKDSLYHNYVMPRRFRIELQSPSASDHSLVIGYVSNLQSFNLPPASPGPTIPSNQYAPFGEYWTQVAYTLNISNSVVKNTPSPELRKYILI